MRKIFAVVGLLLVAVVGGSMLTDTTHAAVNVTSYSSLRETISSIKLSKIQQPAWLKKQILAEAAATVAPSGTTIADGHGRVVTYDVTTKGAITASFAEFRTLANQTLNDNRGWARMNISFKEVASGGQFTLVLAEASQVPTYSSTGCDAMYSCNVGRYVVINQDRWQGATVPWNNAKGSLRDYRHMVVNHETGHWLGHGHAYCSGTGNAAPVMQQQSIGLQGCRFNPWPLTSELTSSTLGLY